MLGEHTQSPDWVASLSACPSESATSQLFLLPHLPGHSDRMSILKALDAPQPAAAIPNPHQDELERARAQVKQELASDDGYKSMGESRGVQFSKKYDPKVRPFDARRSSSTPLRGGAREDGLSSVVPSSARADIGIRI